MNIEPVIDIRGEDGELFATCEFTDKEFGLIIQVALQEWLPRILTEAAAKIISELEIDNESEIDVDSEIDVEFVLRYEINCAHCGVNLSGSPAYTYEDYAKHDIETVYKLRNYHKCCEAPEPFVLPFSAPLASLTKKQ